MDVRRPKLTRGYGAGRILTPALLAALVMLNVAAVEPDHAEKMARGLELFKLDVAGVLKAHCVECHGGEKIKGDFDLTSREGLLRPGIEGPNVEAGKGKESRLYRLIARQEEPHMPQKGEKLPAEAIEKIAAWIDAGAPYDRPLVEQGEAASVKAEVSEKDRDFWSLRPLSEPKLPEVKDKGWCRTAIDPFVMAKLEEKGIAPNGAADRRRLIRRATFDLTGLPPTPEEIEAFLNDTDADAYEKVIDRLLASPHYGERWGRHWMDVARFAESHGYEQDYDRPNAYHYRDFVIKALNMDMPYDRFVRWQIAGDELAPDEPLAMMATGFLAAGTHATQITASQAEKERYDELDDMAATIGTAMLGLTIGCARCHDHKFDPIPISDYYRFVATFTTTVRSDLEINLDPQGYAQERAAWEKEHAALAEARERFERQELPGRLEEWERSGGKPAPAEWLVLEMGSAKASGGATFEAQEDGSLLVSGERPTRDVYTFSATTPLSRITAIKVEAVAHPSLVKGGPGRADNGNFALSDFRVSARPAGGEGAAVELRLARPRATFEQKGLPVAAAVDEDGTWAWAVDPEFGKDHAAVFEIDPPLELEGGAALTFTLKFQNNSGHGIGRPRISVCTAPAPAGVGGEHGPHAVVEAMKILEQPDEARSEEKKRILLKWYRTIDPEWRRLNALVQESVKKQPRPRMMKVLVSSEGVPAVRLHTQGPDFYEKTHFLRRGDLSQKQGEAEPGFLQVLTRTAEPEKRWMVAPPPAWRTSYHRTGLANWITDVEAGAGHLLARVIVNRLWQHHFGRGIVATPSDFGAQGERPTHPELLDWLAQELIREGWRLKPMHRLMMRSAVYMESGEHDEERGAVDPDNLLLWRRPMRRLEAEAIRDAMLAASGTLDRTMFGPGTLDESMRRRSIYFFVKRSKLIPLMMLFDAPDSLQGMGVRPSTTIPPQALAMMNNKQVRGYARAFAQRLAESAAGSAAQAIERAYVLALGRPPGEQEREAAADFLREQVGSYEAAGRENALELALSDFCQALLSLNEFIYIE